MGAPTKTEDLPAADPLAAQQDWADWYGLYDSGMDLAARLRMVCTQIQLTLDECPPGPICLVSVCSGDGRDVLSAVANHPRRNDVKATLLDLDAAALEQGRGNARREGLSSQIEFRHCDATLAANYHGLALADLVVVSGVLGHLDAPGVSRLCESLPMLCRTGGWVLWNRHLQLHHGRRYVAFIREEMAANGFEEIFCRAASWQGFMVARSCFAGSPVPLNLERQFFEFIGINRLIAESSPPPALSDVPDSMGAPLSPDVPLHAHVECLARSQPGRLALDGSWQPTYAQFNHAANRIAGEIFRDASAPGDRVALLMEHDSPLLAGVLAVLKTGRVVVVLNPADPAPRHLQIIEDSEPALILTDPRHFQAAQELSGSRIAVLCVDRQLEGGVVAAPPLEVDPDQTAFIIYTSGSTGRPKGVMQTHRAILYNVHRLTHAMQVGPQDVVLLMASMSSGLGLSTGWVGLLNGACVGVFPTAQIGVSGLAAWLQQLGVTVFSASASIFRSFMRVVGPTAAFPDMRLVRLASEQATAEDFKCFQQHFPPSCRLLHTLSSSEVGNISQLLLGHGDVVPAGPLSVGHAAGGIQIHLEDEQGRAIGPNEVGEIVVRGAHLPAGYWRDDVLTAEKFRNAQESRGLREFRGGDLGRVDEHGQLFYMGRKDHRVKIHGYRVELSEVEVLLNENSAVQEAVVVASPTDGGDVMLVAYLVAQNGFFQDEALLREALREQLPGPMVPAHFVYLEELPLNANGKVDRAGLAQRELPASDGGALEQPETPVEQCLAALWSELFRGQPIGRRSDFFHLGGDSLTAVTLAAQVDTGFGVRLELGEFSAHPKLCDLAAEISQRMTDGAGAGSGASIGRVPRDEPLPLSFQEARTWRYSQTPEQMAGYTVTKFYHVIGPINVAALKESLTFLSRRHEILRCNYQRVGEEVLRVVHPPGEVPFEMFDRSDCGDPESAARQQVRAESRKLFDLQNGSLIRFCLIRMTPDEHLFARINHHIISDGPSWTIYMRELKLVYECLCRGEAPPLPDEVPVQYADYAAWQRKHYRRGNDNWNEMIGWWAKAFEGTPASPMFPFLREKPLQGVDPHEGELMEKLDPSAWELLLMAAKDARTTPYVVHLAIFVAVHAITTQQRDVTVGVYITNRESTETQAIFGFFAQLVPLRLQCETGLTFREWLKVANAVLHGAQSHSAISYEDLCAELRQQGILPPVINMILATEYVQANIQLGPVLMEQRRRTIGVDALPVMPWGISLEFDNEAGVPSYLAGFDANLYNPAGVRHRMHQLARFFSAFAQNPDFPMDQLLPCPSGSVLNGANLRDVWG